MDDSSFVRSIERVCNFDGKRQHRLRVQGLSANAVLQCHSIQKLHGDERPPMLVIDLIDRADVRVVQGRSGLGFALEAVERLRIFSYLVRKELEGDEAAEFYILGFVDHAHAAAAQSFQNPVVRDGLADHAYRRNLRWPYVRVLLLRKSKSCSVQGGIGGGLSATRKPTS